MKIAIITGGSKGLGNALVDIFSSNKWEIIELSRTGTTDYTFVTDLSHIDSTLQAIQKKVRTLPVDTIEQMVYINNAGVLSPIKKTSRLTTDEIIRSLNCNFMSQILLIQEIIQLFRTSACLKMIINISSGAALKGYPGWSLYCAGKAGIENFIRTIYEEEKCEKYPFRVLNFDPYVMDTSMQESIRNSDKEDFPQKERFIEYKKSGKLLSPQTVAASLMNVIRDNRLLDVRYEVIKLISESVVI